MDPRPYQTDFVHAVEKAEQSYRKNLGVAPTGSGKTIIFSFLSKRLFDTTGKKTLILAHREELIDQAIDKLNKSTGLFAAKEKADSYASFLAPVVVGSVQTMVRRYERWPVDHFGRVVVDEAHHALASTYQPTLNHFSCPILGVTATADRADKRSLGEFFENIAHEIKLLDLIRDGYLSKIMLRSLPIQIDLSQVKSVAGDFDSAQLGHAIEPYFDSIARAIRVHAPNRKVLCFLPLIATSQKFVEHLRAAGITADHIDGQMENRKEKLQEFARGDFQVLCNAMLLLEGYDCPAIDCVVMLRPTRSRPLFAQAIGRGTRIHPGKENLLILDFLWLHERHEIVKAASLVADTPEEEQQISELCGGEEMDLLEVKEDARAKREATLAAKLAALAKRKAKFITAEQFALQQHDLTLSEYEPTMAWHYWPVTPGQAKVLEEAGIDPSSCKDQGHASLILDKAIPILKEARNNKPASWKQRFTMKAAGWFHPEGHRTWRDATIGDAISFFQSRRSK